MLQVPGSVPLGVCKMAHWIGANLTEESDKAMLWRLVEHPDMSGVWRELCKMDAAGCTHFYNRLEVADEMWDDLCLAEFFWLAFGMARRQVAVRTIKDMEPRVQEAKLMARTLRRDAETLSAIHTANLDGTREVSEAKRRRRVYCGS
jgi:hypothetical protein